MIDKVPSDDAGLLEKTPRKHSPYRLWTPTTKRPGRTIAVAPDSENFGLAAKKGGELYHHLFQRPDGTQILFVYDKSASPTVQVTLPRAGSAAYSYAGSSTAYSAFDSTTLSDIQLTPGTVAIFRIAP